MATTNGLSGWRSFLNAALGLFGLVSFFARLLRLQGAALSAPAPASTPSVVPPAFTEAPPQAPVTQEAAAGLERRASMSSAATTLAANEVDDSLAIPGVTGKAISALDGQLSALMHAVDQVKRTRDEAAELAIIDDAGEVIEAASAFIENAKAAFEGEIEEGLQATRAALEERVKELSQAIEALNEALASLNAPAEPEVLEEDKMHADLEFAGFEELRLTPGQEFVELQEAVGSVEAAGGFDASGFGTGSMSVETHGTHPAHKAGNTLGLETSFTHAHGESPLARAATARGLASEVAGPAKRTP